MAYWLGEALLPLPALLVMVLGVGWSWALVMLPRRDWRSRPLVACLSLAVGPALVTGWMLILGMIGGRQGQTLLTWPNVALGVAVLSVVGWGLALYKRRVTVAHYPLPRKPLALDERALLLMIYAACVLRFFAAVWYPFFEYDPLWVYAYQGKLYPLLGYIPESIGYYPQLLPLSYAYAQLAAGQISDHAARAAFPLFHWGAALASYSLGAYVFSRRAGIYLAALWTLYPHVADWSIVGDLEIPLTFSFTGGALFLLMAWTHSERRTRLHYAALAGFFLGVAMWTKPTGGAFILGVMGLFAAELVRTRGRWRAWWPRFEVALVTGLACLPLGAVWYIRNLALGHPPIDFPHPFWPTQAQRSAAEFGWPILALGVLLLALYTARLRVRPSLRWVGVGVVLLAGGLLPSLLNPHRLALPEWLLLAGGAGVLAAVLLPYLRDHAPQTVKQDVGRIGWALLLALPYFAVWFMSYSYHYRLSFPIVPLMALPVAVTLARWLPPRHNARHLGWGYGLLLLAGLPGVILPLYKADGGWGYLWSARFPDDDSKQKSLNPALFYVVERINENLQDSGDSPPVIIAPGVQRLPFFFPLLDVRNTVTPVSLDELPAGSLYVYSQEGRWLYEEAELPAITPVTGALGRSEVFRYRGCARDSSFFGCVYRKRPDALRRSVPDDFVRLEPAPQWGDFARLVAYGWEGGDQLGGAGDAPTLILAFEALEPAPLDYTLYIHLIDEDGAYITGWDSLPAPANHGYTYYSTRLWQAGEVVQHRVALTLPADVQLTAGRVYTLRVGMYDVFAAGAPRLPLAYPDGRTEDGVTLPVRLTGAR